MSKNCVRCLAALVFSFFLSGWPVLHSNVASAAPSALKVTKSAKGPSTQQTQGHGNLPEGTNRPSAGTIGQTTLQPALSEQHQFDVDITEIASHTLEGLLWPLFAFLVVFAFVRSSERILQLRLHPPFRSSPPPNVPDNSQISVTNEERIQAASAAEKIMTAFRRHGSDCSDRQKIVIAAPVGADADTKAALSAAKRRLEPYFHKAFERIFASQLRFLESLGVRSLSYADAKTFLAHEQSVEGWIRFLVRLEFVDRSSLRGPQQTCVTITDLGKLFLGWCDARGLTVESVRVAES